MELEDYECSVCTGGCAVWDGEPGMLGANPRPINRKNNE